MSLSKPVPNLDLMNRIAGAWDTKMRKVLAKNKDLRKYMGKGGARIPAILTNIFPLGEGANVFSRGFGCYLLNTHSAEPEDSEALSDTGFPGHEKIKLKVSFNPKADAPPPPVGIGAHPAEVFLTSRTSANFQTGDMEALAKLKPGQIVLLNGVNVRAYLATKDGPPRWGLAYDVQVIEAVHGLTIASLWPAARGAGTDFLLPNEMFYDEAVKSSRYNRDATHIISVFSTPTTEEGRKERLLRMWNENGETRLVTRDWSNKTWEIEAFQARPRKIKASLELVHTQWPNAEHAEDMSETILIGVSLWDEHLRDFGISDVSTWVDLAPMIFNKLDFKVIGYVDTKGTESNFGGVESDKDVAFALQIGGMGIIADIEACYRSIGIPVTAECVVDLQQMAGGAPGGGAAISQDADEFIEKLHDVVPVSGAGASSSVARKLIDMGRADDSKIDFRALVKYVQSPAVIKGLATLNAEEGSQLVNALAINSDAEIVNNAKVHGLYEMMSTGNAANVVAFALCSGIVPEEVKSKRNADLITYMAGRAPKGAAAIEDGSASAAAAAAPAVVEELDDDDGGHGAAISEDDVDAEEIPRKASVKRSADKEKKSKRPRKKNRS